MQGLATTKHTFKGTHDMDHIKRFFKKDRFAEWVGIELLDASPGFARAKMQIREHHLNGLNMVHGAAIFSLADLVFAVASNSHGNAAVAVNVSISFLKAASGDTLYGEATELSRNPRLASYNVRITDERETLIAVFQGMVYIKKDRIDFE